VAVVRGRDVERVDVGQCPVEVRRRAGEPEAVRRCRGTVGVATDEDRPLDGRGVGEEHREAGEGVRVRPGGEAVAEEGDRARHGGTAGGAVTAPSAG
jgi:hypothetical protein